MKKNRKSKYVLSSEGFSRVEGEMSRVQIFQIYLFIYLLIWNLLLYHSLYLVVVSFPAFLQVTEMPGC